MKGHKLIQDRFRRNRGGYTRLLKIYCERCGNFVALYQKDGPGALKRMYLDRIFLPKTFTYTGALSYKKLPNLVCSECKQVIGVPMLYQKEKRPAFRLFEGSVIKKISRAQ